MTNCFYKRVLFPRVLFGVSFFPKSCLKVGGVAYTRVFTVLYIAQNCEVQPTETMYIISNLFNFTVVSKYAICFYM